MSQTAAMEAVTIGALIVSLIGVFIYRTSKEKLNLLNDALDHMAGSILLGPCSAFDKDHYGGNKNTPRGGSL